MARVGCKNQAGRMIIFWAVCLVAVCTQCAASDSTQHVQWHTIWHKVRDFFFRRRTCNTLLCEKAAQSIIANRNITVDPCDDFYEFTCGGWIAANPVPKNQNNYDQFQEAAARVNKRIKDILETNDEQGDTESIKKARKIYGNCLNSDEHADENLQVLLDRLSKWGGWPLAMENWDRSKFDWQKLLVDLIRTDNLVPLLTISVSIDRRNTSRYTVIIDQAHIRFCHDHLLRGDDGPEREMIRKIVAKIAKATNQTITESQLKTDIRSLLSLEIGLCKMLKTINQRQDEFQLYNPTTLEKLQNDSTKITSFLGNSQVNWVDLMNDLLSGSGVDVDKNFGVVVHEPDVIFDTLLLLNNMPPRTVANYMLWQKIAHLHNEISEEFRNMGYMYAEQTTGASGIEPRWKHCAQNVNDGMPHAIGYEYVKLHFGEDDKKKAHEIVVHILKSFIDDLKNIDWMDPRTRSLAVEKAENMVMAVGYPDWYNKTNVDEIYKEYNAGDSYLINLENLNLASHIQNCKWLNKPEDRAISLFNSIADVNAYYFPGANMICIPAGIFQAPFYVKGRPEAMNYGGIGVVVGHEVSHAFDVQGRFADKFGNLAQWWEKRTLDTYHVKKSCVEKQYSEYPIPVFSTDRFEVHGLDGEGTVSENIADNGGLQQAFKAYKRYVDEHGSEMRLPGLKNYSPEQLFFIGFATVWCKSSTDQSMIEDIAADVHSPSRYRVLIPLGNSEQFADAWKCRSSGSKVTQKCKFW